MNVVHQRKNNGTVGGHHYFTCADKLGFLCHPRFVIRVADAVAAGIAAPSKEEALKEFKARGGMMSPPNSQQQQPPQPPQQQPQQSSGSVLTLSNNVLLFSPADVGGRVHCEGMSCGATLRFVGPHNESGEPRVGVELDQPVGKNNGTVGGHLYFTCADKHGLLCHPMHVSRAVETGGGNGAGAGAGTIAPAPAPARLDLFESGAPVAGSVPYLDVAPDPLSSDDEEVDLDELDVDKPARLLTDYGDNTRVQRRMSAELSGVASDNAHPSQSPAAIAAAADAAADAAAAPVTDPDFC